MKVPAALLIGIFPFVSIVAVKCCIIGYHQIIGGTRRTGDFSVIWWVDSVLGAVLGQLVAFVLALKFGDELEFFLWYFLLVLPLGYFSILAVSFFRKRAGLILDD